MTNHRRRDRNNSVNAGSMADIAFLLLIFFLVTTEIMEETGIRVKLPAWEPNPPIVQIDQDRVLSILVNASNDVLIEKQSATVEVIKDRTKEFIMNPKKLENLPSKPKNAIISLQNDRGTSYRKYVEVYNEVKAAYNELWEAASQTRFGKSYEELNELDRQDVRKDIPLVISEAEPTDAQRGK